MIKLLAGIFTFGVLILIHEYGHYRVALACGVKVLRFSVGFGRVIWRRQPRSGGTEFVVCALPLGGYVKMLDEREGPVEPNELERSFNRKPLLQRAAIVAAGPAANLLLAVVLYTAAHWVGVDEPRAVMGTPLAGSLAERAGLHAGDWARATSTDGTQWHDLRSMTDLGWELQQALLRSEPLQLMVTDRAGHAQRIVHLPLDTLGSSDIDAGLLRRIGLGGAMSEPVLGKVVAGGAGARAGLLEGDRVLRIDGTDIVDATGVRNLILASMSNGAIHAMHWQIERQGRLIDLNITPELVEEAGVKSARINVVPGQPPEMIEVRYGFIEGITKAASQTWQMSTMTLKVIGKMLVGEASLKNLSGPLTIADYAGRSVSLGLAYYLSFLAVVSVSLGVLNLLPLPVLDGGHLMYYLFEGVTGRAVSEVWLDRLQRGGVAIMLMMMSVALYNDVVRFLGLQ